MALTVSFWLSDSHSGSQWLSVAATLWHTLAHYCSLISRIQPLIGSQVPCLALIADATMTHFLLLCYCLLYLAWFFKNLFSKNINNFRKAIVISKNHINQVYSIEVSVLYKARQCSDSDPIKTWLFSWQWDQTRFVIPTVPVIPWRISFKYFNSVEHFGLPASSN